MASMDIQKTEDERVEGSMSVHDATLLGKIPEMRSLLSSGNSANVQDSQGYTPLHLAASTGDKDMVKLLVAKGANVVARSNDNAVPLHLAASGGHRTVVNILIAEGADVDSRDKTGMTPLHYACIEGSKTVVKLLTSKGARADATDNNGRAASYFASLGSDLSHFEIRALLLEVEELQKFADKLFETDRPSSDSTKNQDFFVGLRPRRHATDIDIPSSEEPAVLMPPEKFPYLNEFFAENSMSYHTADAEGNVVLFFSVSYEECPIIMESQWGVSWENEKNELEIYLVINDQPDDPLRIPYIFSLEKELHRHEAVQLVEQDGLHFYALTRAKSGLYFHDCRIISLPGDFRQELAYGLRTMLADMSA